MALNSSITLSGTGKFSGDGSLLTNVPYTIITGKPSFFQTDWNSTISNKPAYFQTDWNTTISNKPTTFPIDTTIYYNKTEVNNLLNAKQASISTYAITGATGGTFEFSAGTLTLGMPTNYTASMSLSNLITPTSFIYKGTELSTTFGSYSTTAINDTKYLKLDGANNMALNSSITLSGTGKFIGDGSLLTNLPLSAYSTTAINDTKYLELDGTNNMALNSSITLSGTGKFIGDGSLLTNLPLSAYSTTAVNDTKYLELDGTNTMAGDIYIDKTDLSLSRGVYLSGKSNEISSLFSSKPPFAAYFAEDFTGSTIPNYLKNGRDATTTGTINKTTAEGNGVNTPITYITGTSTSTISFAAGSIPTTFTILSFTRYNGGTRQRILTSKTTGDWCHGHRNNNRGAVRYVIDRAIYSYISQIDNWACVIGKNVGSTGSILLNGVDNSLNQNGTGGFTLGINNGAYPAEYGDWAFNCVIIWDTALTNAEMVLLNGMINTYKSTGESLKQYFNDDCIMENREYTTNSSRELLLLKSNNLNSSFGTDRIRLKATNILFDTFSTATTDKTETTQMIIDSSGNIGIGTTTNISSKLYINGNININNSVNPFLKLGGNDNNLGVATIGGSFSPSAATGDMVLRSVGNLILQSGIGFYAIKINTANNVEFRLTLTAPTINLTTSTTGNNVLYIKSTVASANNCIQFQNDLNKTAYIGYGGSAFPGGGNYINNFFIENANGSIILNSQGRTSTSTPNLLINTAGNVITSGDITTGGSINITNINTVLDFGARGQDNIIKLWSGGTDIYGFGINNATLRYNVPATAYHRFYTGTTNTFTIDGSGNAISSAYMYAGGTTSGIRINGNDYGNTFYQDAVTIGGQPANVGFTLRETNSFNFNSLVAGVGYKTFMTMSTSGIRIPQTSYTFAIADWYLYQGTAPGSITNSFIFFHSTSTGFNSKWWFNGTQTATSSEISDERVKTDIEPITDGLNKVMKLQPKKFNVLNDKNKKFQYGFISQDIEKEMPEIIYKENHYIANVYDYGNHKDRIITMKKYINGLINIGDELKIILDNDDENKEYLLNASYEYNLFKKRFCKVIKIIDDYSFEIDINICISEEEPPTATRERQLAIPADEVFIYGKYVNDFKTLEYNSLISLNVCATQELYKLIEQQNIIIQDLQNQINELKQKN